MRGSPSTGASSNGLRKLRGEYEAYRQTKRWKKLRRAVELRAHGRCEICQRAQGDEVAHLGYARMFTERLCDLLWVCLPCHRALDQDE